MNKVGVLIAGIFFGIVLMKGEVISWFRIYEMFRFESFHMFGIIGTAVFFGAALFQIIKRFNLKDIHGEPITFTPKPKKYTANLIGGTMFGLGWAMTGACPGPILAMLGSGMMIFGVILISAVVGTFLYGIVQHKLPQ